MREVWPTRVSGRCLAAVRAYDSMLPQSLCTRALAVPDPHGCCFSLADGERRGELTIEIESWVDIFLYLKS